jgi:hypothetical protein
MASGLRTGAHDQRRGDCSQAPSGGDAFDLPCGVVAVAAGTDQRCVGSAVDPVEGGVIAAIEEILHQPRNRGEIFRRGKNIAIGVDHVVRLRRGCMQQPCPGTGFARGAFDQGVRHLFGTAGHRVVNDE